VHAQVDVVDGAVGEEGRFPALGDRPELGVVGELGQRLCGGHAFAADHLREDRCLAVEQHAISGYRSRDGHRRAHLAQRRVDLLAQRVAHHQIREYGAEHDHDRDGGAARQREPAPEAHRSRST
jgi:hypothetical protein